MPTVMAPGSEYLDRRFWMSSAGKAGDSWVTGIPLLALHDREDDTNVGVLGEQSGFHLQYE